MEASVYAFEALRPVSGRARRLIADSVHVPALIANSDELGT